MQIKDIKYETFKSNNQPSAYSIFRYAEKWADLMESEITKGSKIENIADRLSHEADTDGITGFMYNTAVTILSSFWLYGDDLRMWHNKKYGYEGDGLINSSTLTIRGKA